MSDLEIPAPRDTYDLVGHEAAEARLLEAWKSGRMPHAWLLTGPPGIGKATLAFRMARFVLSEGTADMPGPDMFGAGPETLAIDPDSQTSRRVASGGHQDFRYLTVKKGDKQISSLGAGDCFGEMGYLTKIRRTASISATAEVTVMQINATMMERASVTCQLRFNKIFLTTLIERLARTSEELTRAL